jgi:hypothetical protein
MILTVEQAKRLHGIEDGWHMAPEEENFLVRITESLVQEHGENWVREHQEFLKLELRYIFQVFL